MVRVHTDAGTVDTHLLVLRIDAGAEFGDQLAINLNTPVGYDLLAFATGAEPRLGKKLLQANALIIVIVRLGGARICVWDRSPNVAG